MISRPIDRRRTRRRLPLDQHPVQLLEITIIEKPADRVRRDVTCALLVKLVSGHEFKAAIGARQRSLQARVKETVGLQNDHAGSAIRMAICQPEEGHGSV
jgi:hypothetical protein